MEAPVHFGVIPMSRAIVATYHAAVVIAVADRRGNTQVLPRFAGSISICTKPRAERSTSQERCFVK
jgi:hypothetical protein